MAVWSQQHSHRITLKEKPNTLRRMKLLLRANTNRFNVCVINKVIIEWTRKGEGVLEDVKRTRRKAIVCGGEERKHYTFHVVV